VSHSLEDSFKNADSFSNKTEIVAQSRLMARLLNYFCRQNRGKQTILCHGNYSH